VRLCLLVEKLKPSCSTHGNPYTFRP
jgi:hypothetical protein